MNNSQQLLSDVVVYNKYAKFNPVLGRRETWNEIIDRYIGMMLDKYPQVSEEIKEYSSYIYDKKVLPSMRGLQFAGAAIEVNEARIFNCSYLPVTDTHAFSETMFLLLSGCGVGYSVQKQHVDKLPRIHKPEGDRKYVIDDSIMGWADAVKVLMKSYFGQLKQKPKFVFSQIRPKGARLVTAGGKAPGPEPLQRCLNEIELILERKENGSKLTPLEAHDILCHIANAVLAGGIRRSAMISLFSYDDLEMISCKAGAWWELNPQRGRANNSAVLDRNNPIQKEEFDKLWKSIEASNAGEPGIYWSNDLDYGTNPLNQHS